MHELLIFPIASVVIRNQPGNTVMDGGWHVHVAEGINEGPPWDFLLEFFGKVGEKGRKVLKRFEWSEIDGWCVGPGVDSFDGPVALTSSYNGLTV
jgi:hypothetical protein